MYLCLRSASELRGEEEEEAVNKQNEEDTVSKHKHAKNHYGSFLERSGNPKVTSPPRHAATVSV